MQDRHLCCPQNFSLAPQWPSHFFSSRIATDLESLHKKLTSRVELLRRLAGSGWGAGATTLRTATLALVHSTAEYCAPVWCRSAYTRLIDPTINDALRIVTGCLSPTPADKFPILAGIQPAELRGQRSHTISRTPCHMPKGAPQQLFWGTFLRVCLSPLNSNIHPGLRGWTFTPCQHYSKTKVKK